MIEIQLASSLGAVASLALQDRQAAPPRPTARYRLGPVATHAFDTGAIAKLIADGISHGLTAEELAARVVDFIDDPGLGRAMNHPVRRAIVRLLRTEGPHSPVQTAKKIDASLAKVAYHFRELAKDGVVELCETVPRRGAVEHIYRLPAIKLPT